MNKYNPSTKIKTYLQNIINIIQIISSYSLSIENTHVIMVK